MTIPDATDDPLAEALRAKLRSLLDEPLSPKTLAQLEATARLAKDLLAVGKHPMRRRGSGMGMFPGSVSLAPGYDTEPYEDETPMAGSPRAETFGATMIREAVSAYADIMTRPKPPSPHEIILAISYAKAHEMPELAAKLEAELEKSLLGGAVPALVAEPAVVAMPAPPFEGKFGFDKQFASTQEPSPDPPRPRHFGPAPDDSGERGGAPMPGES